VYYLFLALLNVLSGLPAQPKPDTNVILITLDGVRWQEVFNGTDPLRSRQHQTARQLLPNLYDLFFDHGLVVGQKSPMVASGPNHISLPGYLEMSRGHQSFDCQTNDCHPIIDQSIFWFFQQPALFASWNMLARTVPSNMDVIFDVGRTGRSESWKQLKLSDDQTFPSPFSYNREYRPDYYTEVAAMDYLRYQRPDFAWISLGDTDEYGHANDYAAYLAALRQADTFVGNLIHWLEQSDYGKNTVFIMTADHGRNNNFRDHGLSMASARVWAVFHGKNIPNLGSIQLNQPISLSNLFPTIEEISWGVVNQQSVLTMSRGQ
jgi:arylsulfatase A-like enzyme